MPPAQASSDVAAKISVVRRISKGAVSKISRFSRSFVKWLDSSQKFPSLHCPSKLLSQFLVDHHFAGDMIWLWHISGELDSISAKFGWNRTMYMTFTWVVLWTSKCRQCMAIFWGISPMTPSATHRGTEGTLHQSLRSWRTSGRFGKTASFRVGKIQYDTITVASTGSLHSSCHVRDRDWKLWMCW